MICSKLGLFYGEAVVTALGLCTVPAGSGVCKRFRMGEEVGPFSRSSGLRFLNDSETSKLFKGKSSWQKEGGHSSQRAFWGVRFTMSSGRTQDSCLDRRRGKGSNIL